MALTKIPSSLLDTSGGFDLQGNITLGDNEKIILGDSSDLQIYHDSSTNDSIITESGDGNLVLQGNSLRLTSVNGVRYLQGNSGAEVNLWYAGSKKFETTSTGATVTGVLTATSVNTGQGDYELYAMDQNVRTTDSPAFAAATINGTLTVTGDLDITGDINSYNVTDLDVTDKTITLGAGQTEANSGGSGIIIDGSSASILWDETNTEFDINNSINVTGSVTTSQSISINNSQVGTIQQAHGIASGNTIANKFQVGRWKGTTFDRWMLVPINDGTAEYSNEFGYNFSTGAWFIDDKLGIGTASPAYSLDVTNNSTGIQGRLSSSSSNGTSFALQNSATNGRNYRIGSNFVTGAGEFAIYDDTASAERMRIDSSGNVGIGATNPSEKLHMNNTAGTACFIRFENTGGSGVYIGGRSEVMEMYTNGSEKMRITSDGKVGIGTNGPSARLHVRADSGSESIMRIRNENTTSRTTTLQLEDYSGALADGILKFVFPNAGSTTGSYLGLLYNSAGLYVAPGGNVGISVTSPSEKLEVDGGLKISNSNSRLYFGTEGGTSYRALEGNTSGSLLQVGEGYTDIALQGNVGIGTTGPTKTLSVKAPSGSNGGIDVFHNNGNKVAELVHHGSGDEGRLSLYDGGANTVQIHGETGQPSYINSGNVGIGTSSPGEKLDVQKSGDNIIQTTGVVSGGVTALKLRQSRGSLSSPTNSSTNGDGNYIVSQIYRSSAYNTNAWIGLVTDSATDDGRIVFGTASGGTVAERMRINSAGSVLINRFTSALNTFPTAPLVLGGGSFSSSEKTMIHFDDMGQRGTGTAQTIDFSMGRTAVTPDAAKAQIAVIAEASSATAASHFLGYELRTAAGDVQEVPFKIQANGGQVKFNTTEQPQSGNPRTGQAIVIGPSTQGAVTQGLTSATVLQNRSGELYAVDSSHNNTQLTPHNWTLISDGPSEELAWTYWSQRPNPDNPEQLQGINVDMAKVARKVEDLVGEKLVYTENSNMDDHTHQNIIADIQSTLADLTTRIEALEG